MLRVAWETSWQESPASGLLTNSQSKRQESEMTKFFGGVVAGIFVGALAVEILGRTNPRLLEKIEESTFNVAGRIKDLVAGRPRVRSRY